MNLMQSDSVLLVGPEETFQEVVSRMANGNDRVIEIALIVDSENALLGVINTGDVLRHLAKGVDAQLHISELMVRNPITVKEGSSDARILEMIRVQLRERGIDKKNIVRYVPLLDDNGVVIDLIDVLSLIARQPQTQGSFVEVYGLGFVGLTLAVALAGRGHHVTGIDSNRSLVKQLQDGKPHVFEPRLSEMLRLALKEGMLEIRNTPSGKFNRVAIIAVGTPVGSDGSVSLEALRLVCEVVSSRLKCGDLIMLRSTVPVGTTRKFVREILEIGSGLKAGKDFFLAFAPERTAEGQAMQELVSLPQIVGGLTPKCTEVAASFWQSLSTSIVRVESLEAAELVKLINNSFRDLSFAFSNGLALLADNYNLDASKIISSANEGYPRNPIPKPSPGVGGYCLTKDPFLYASSDQADSHRLLSIHGREINSKASKYPVEVLSRFARRRSLSLSELTVLIVGVAFKGWPETNDLRGSISVDVGADLLKMGCKVLSFDAVVDKNEIEKLGFKPVDLIEGASVCDAVLILNNHPDNIPDGILTALRDRNTLLFDGWSQIDRYEVELQENIVYATMGYMTPQRD